MSDDLLERVRARARDNSFWRYLGVEVMEASEGKVRLRVPVRDELRNELVPLNRKYPIRELLDACRNYPGLSNARRITFEYVMLAGVNDSDRHADELIVLLQSTSAKVNLIPFNPFPRSGFERSSWNVVRRFNDRLNVAGIVTTTRKTRGEDIDAACGQLAGQVQDRTRRVQRLVRTAA